MTEARLYRRLQCHHEGPGRIQQLLSFLRRPMITDVRTKRRDPGHEVAYILWRIGRCENVNLVKVCVVAHSSCKHGGFDGNSLFATTIA